MAHDARPNAIQTTSAISGAAYRAGGLDCVGSGVVGHQEPSVEGCAAGEDSIVDSGVAGQLVGRVQTMQPVAGIRGKDGEHAVIARFAATQTS